MNNQESQERRIKVEFTPGFYNPERVHFHIFEQVEGNQFVAGRYMQLQKTVTVIQDDREVVYTPLERAPWSLCSLDAMSPLSNSKEEWIKNLNRSVDEEKLWNDVHDYVHRHLFLPGRALYDVLTAWVYATWVREIWTVVPYIFFYGPVASGKTRGLEVLQRLAYRGILASSMSAAALFRASDLWHPTLFLDETEIYNKETKTEVIGLLNSGYRKGQYAYRVKSADHGAELQAFDVFGFKALAGTKGLAQALESRSIIIRMIKARRKVERLIDESEAKILRNQLLRWRFKKLAGFDVSDVSDVFSEGIPALDFGDGRLDELFMSLLAVSNKGRENILEYARELYEIRESEEKASEEAEIIRIIAEQDVVDERNIALTSDIAEIFNKNRSEREKWKTRSIGWKMRELGFNRMSTGQARGWIVDPQRLEYWTQIYGIHPSPLEKRQKRKKRQDKPTVQETLKVLRSSLQKPFKQNNFVESALEMGLSETEANTLFQQLVTQDAIGLNPEGFWQWI